MSYEIYTGPRDSAGNPCTPLPPGYTRRDPPGQNGDGLDNAWVEGSDLGMEPGEECVWQTDEERQQELDAMRMAGDAEVQLLPADSQTRKEMPVYSGVVKYFPRSLAYLARVSFIGNEKHNPGEPLQWSRGKSNDHLDCVARHLIDCGRIDPEDGIFHDGKLAWRALANLEIFLEQLETK